MVMKNTIIAFSSLILFSMACTKEKAENTIVTNNQVDNSTAFKAQIMIANTTKSWKSAPAITTLTVSNAVAGIDYFANRGGINPNELTLISFGKFTDDTAANAGRLTLFLNSVNKTGIYEIGRTTPNYGVISILNGGNLENYSTNQNKFGSVIISKYDTVNNIISGTFTFNALFETKELSISNGSFTNIPFKQ